MPKIDLFRVFIASPGDVIEERGIVREILDSVNRTLGNEKGGRFEIVGWDTDTYPAFGADAQSIINDQIADMSEYDLFIGIMWNRFGSETPRAGSGTEEEFNLAVDSLRSHGRPQIMFYFNQAPYSPKTASESEQKTKVMLFQETIKNNGLPAFYNGPEDFRRKFHNHIEQWFIRQTLTPLKTPHNVDIDRSESSKDEKVENSDMWVLLDKGFFQAKEVVENGQNNVSIRVVPKNAEEDAFVRSLQPKPSIRPEPIPFAHQNNGAIARVIQATRHSLSTGTMWEITLEIENLNYGFLTEMGFYNISADKIAEMRAKYLLLNEEPSVLEKPDGSEIDILNDGMLKALVYGINTRVKVTDGVIPSLWKDFRDNPSTFLHFARLWCIFHLIASNTCERIINLTFGPISSGKLHIHFKGQRRKVYSNVEPYMIEFEGDCNLENV